MSYLRLARQWFKAESVFDTGKLDYTKGMLIIDGSE
jgi:hypothetical protein